MELSSEAKEMHRLTGVYLRVDDPTGSYVKIPKKILHNMEMLPKLNLPLPCEETNMFPG